VFLLNNLVFPYSKYFLHITYYYIPYLNMCL